MCWLLAGLFKSVIRHNNESTHTVETKGKQGKQNTEKGANKYLSRAQFVECESGMNGKKRQSLLAGQKMPRPPVRQGKGKRKKKEKEK